MNWGKGLVIGLASFMLFITLLAIKMSKSAEEDSFDKDYYEKGLHYDVEYQQKQQVITDHVQPIIKQTDDFVNINLVKVDSGTVNFKRPADSKKDQLFSINKTETQIPKSGLEKGEWQIVIQWKVGAKKYLYQKNLFMP